ncbi:hypothetical protein NIE88_16545 [Sporolactobacillus shoreicorticis]|uniref:Lipoprotein n=1 Tax=Sporolactobacillus shoreicorticis TaxID=1923877 RepID=A0ABW5S4J9_9BACL|nr:hypothetical protein [Sporolactobacillus shoreicorticis]MCO7127379.1 hypothetical protein [Sporolactobacillus shoreicorticis]
MKTPFLKIIILLSVFSLMMGCSNENDSPSSNNKKTTSALSQDSSKSSDIKRSQQTIRTVLTYIFTGPDNEQKKLYKKQMTNDPQALYPYLEEKYKSLLEKQYLQEFLKNNQGTTWLQTAYRSGYQLEPVTKIKIKKSKTNTNAYTFEFDVAYSKNDKTNTSTVYGNLATAEDGKIVSINVIDDGGLVKKMTLSK